MKIKKKPVVVDGWPVVDLLAMAKMGAATLPKEVREAYAEGLIEFEADRITVATMEGVMTAPEGWWLIRGVQGEWSPCEAEILMKTYDVMPAEDLGHSFKHPVIDPYGNSPEV